MRTVLLVEPDERTRAYCRRALEAEGCRVLEAADGPGPLGGAAPDLVVCDLTATVRVDVEGLRRALPGSRVVSFAAPEGDWPRVSLSGLSLLGALARALRACSST